MGRGVFYGSAMTEAMECSGEHVVLVGGANSAGQAAAFVSRFAAKVTIAIRGPSLDASMSRYLINQLAAIPNVEVRTCTRLVTCKGDDHLECVELVDDSTGEREQVPTNHVFVFIGAAPLTDWLPGQIRRDESGFVLTGPDLVSDGGNPSEWPLDRQPYLLESSVPGVFVAGDVRSQSVKRVASAVGEGAMAVQFVHEYLKEM